MSRIAHVALFAAVALAGAAAAQAPGERLRDSAADSIDFTQDPLTELPLALPGAPKAADLVQFDPGRPTSMRFFVDPASVSVGNDGIVRFTLVARGDGAAMNVSYEGIRCRPAQRKVFAYGRNDGSWSQPREPKWVEISSVAPDAPRVTLYQEYFCPSRQIVASAGEGVEALRRGGHPRAMDLLTGAPIRR